MARAEDQARQGHLREAHNPHAGRVRLEWLPRRERSDKGLRSTTVASYGYYIRDDIAPSALGRMKLTDIRRYHVQEFLYDATKAGRGAVTVRRLATLLGTIFATAVKDELISANPARGVDRPNRTVAGWIRGSRTRCACFSVAALSTGWGRCLRWPS